MHTLCRQVCFGLRTLGIRCYLDKLRWIAHKWTDYAFQRIKVRPKRTNFAFRHAGRRRKDMWWAHQDSNLEPRDYESPALTVEL